MPPKLKLSGGVVILKNLFFSIFLRKFGKNGSKMMRWRLETSSKLIFGPFLAWKPSFMTIRVQVPVSDPFKNAKNALTYSKSKI